MVSKKPFDIFSKDEDSKEEDEDKGRSEMLPSLLMKTTTRGDTGDHSFDEYNALNELLRPGEGEELDARSEVNENQIIQFARARAIADYHGIPALDDFVNDILRLSLSKGRKSRKEFVKAMSSTGGNDDYTPVSFMEKLK